MIHKICVSIIIISVFASFGAVIVNFTYATEAQVKKGRRSIVATGSMVAYFIFYFCINRIGVGYVEASKSLSTVFLIIGTAMIAFGAYFNIWGRLRLGKNWANHIKIYERHNLVVDGAYKYVRHPLYSSIMLMLYGGSLVYCNYLSALATTFIFVPSMYYRAKQEENMLMSEFSDYELYSERTGMFFPKIWR